MSPKEQIQSLRDELREHNYNYYVNDNPTISDFEFDKKLEQLKTLEAAHPEFYDSTSPSVRVGGEVTKNFNTVRHINRMYRWIILIPSRICAIGKRALRKL
ncbi:DNA ligase [Nonlabens ulvanivorans]|uniref:DNA ligase n=1 Tax=Nonlabens ulvanivorans TaxID=906888 RepID=A0A090QDU4_NONUL|nr:DNA ligase [Nonlabens ulvanivorans]